MPLRDAQSLDAGERRTLERFFEERAEGTHLWVADDESGVIGAAYAECLTDYFSRERHGHLGILVVSQAAQGRGVGQALLKCVESWGREQGFRFLTLNVFFANEGARRFYERAAFSPDFVRYIKPLNTDS